MDVQYVYKFSVIKETECADYANTTVMKQNIIIQELNMHEKKEKT